MDKEKVKQYLRLDYDDSLIFRNYMTIEIKLKKTQQIFLM